MAKRVTKKVNSTELDSKEFFAAIAQIEEEKGIKKGYMMEKITQALISAYRRDHEGVGDNLTVEANEETGVVRMFLKKEVVEEVDNPGTEISLSPGPWRPVGGGPACPCPEWSWGTPSALRSSPRTSAASPPRLPARSSFRESGRRSRG